MFTKCEQSSYELFFWDLGGSLVLNGLTSCSIRRVGRRWSIPRTGSPYQQITVALTTRSPTIVGLSWTSSVINQIIYLYNPSNGWIYTMGENIIFIFWKLWKRILMFVGRFSKLLAFSVSAVACGWFFGCRQCNCLAPKLSGEVRGGQNWCPKKFNKVQYINKYIFYNLYIYIYIYVHIVFRIPFSV